MTTSSHPDFTSFADFMRAVDAHLVARVGLVHEFLPDAMWRDYFDDGLSIAEAIECAAEDGDWISDGFWLAYADGPFDDPPDEHL